MLQSSIIPWYFLFSDYFRSATTQNNPCNATYGVLFFIHAVHALISHHAMVLRCSDNFSSTTNQNNPCNSWISLIHSCCPCSDQLSCCRLSFSDYIHPKPTVQFMEFSFSFVLFMLRSAIMPWPSLFSNYFSSITTQNNPCNSWISLDDSFRDIHYNALIFASRLMNCVQSSFSCISVWMHAHISLAYSVNSFVCLAVD
jgi:hypothetical protein